MIKVKYPVITTLFLLSSILIGCSDKDVETDTTVSSDSVSQTVDQQEDELVVDELEEKASSKLPPAPLESYKDINEDDDTFFFETIKLAQDSNVLTDEYKLESYKEYNLKADAFEKKELAKTLLPKINSGIANYEKNGYRFKMPIIYSLEKQLPDVEKNHPSPMYVPSSSFDLGSYDFEKKGFPINACDKSFDSRPLYLGLNDKVFSGTRGYDLRIDVYQAPKEAIDSECILLIEDENQAKKIEQLRTTSQVAAIGYAYFDIPVRKGEYEVMAQPIQIDITYINRDTEEVLATKSLTW